MITHLEPDILECEVKRALESITMNKASGGDGIPVELFQILKGDAVKVLHSICQQIWKTQQWPQDWKRSVFIPIPKKGNAKECSNYRTIALISHASKVMLKILQARLQPSMKYSLCFSNFLEEISSLSYSVFLYFFALITEKGFLIFLCNSLELCIQMGISFLFSFAFSFSSFLSYL